jgi:hypothetical protein
MENHAYHQAFGGLLGGRAPLRMVGKIIWRTYLLDGSVTDSF